MTTGDRSHSATETVEAERETHQSEGFGARQWTKRFRAPQSPKPLKQNWIAKASSALSRRLHNSKVLIISVNMVLVIILLLFKAATLYKWPVWIETLLQNDPDYTADQIFHTLIPKLAQMDTWRDHNAQLKAHTDQIYAQVNGQITLFSIGVKSWRKRLFIQILGRIMTLKPITSLSKVLQRFNLMQKRPHILYRWNNCCPQQSIKHLRTHIDTPISTFDQTSAIYIF